MDYKQWHDAHFKSRPIWWAVFAVLLLLILGVLAPVPAEAGSAQRRAIPSDESVVSFCSLHIDGIMALAQEVGEPDENGVMKPKWTAESMKANFHDWLVNDSNPHHLYQIKKVVEWVENLMDEVFSSQSLDHDWWNKKLEECTAAVYLQDTSASSDAFLRDQFCEARVIAEFSKTLNEKEWLEVIQLEYEMGRIELKHAEALVDLIREVYSIVDRDAWARARCRERDTRMTMPISRG